MAHVLRLLALFLLPPAAAFAQVGDVTVHDPSIVKAGDTYYVFSTGRGISCRTSTDLFHWTKAPPVFATVPQWTRAFDPSGTSLWAPDIAYHDGDYRLYYAVSTFGSTHSAIGLATNKTLDRSGADFKWVDRGVVVQTPADHDWNAIDPCAFDDDRGRSWLVCGSCWSGIKLLGLDPATGMVPPAAPPPLPIAGRPSNHIIEEGYVRRRGDHYYLWVSVDHCCRRAKSDYRLLVGRSTEPTGPYLDRDGRPMTDGGGTLVLAGYDNVRGPGSSAVIGVGADDYLIHHFYDGAKDGHPTLHVRRLFWAADGWPVAGEPITRPVGSKPPARPSPAGTWAVMLDFGKPESVSLNADGTAANGGRAWSLTANQFSLNRPDMPVPPTYSDDGSYFVGRDRDGRVVRGVRMP